MLCIAAVLFLRTFMTVPEPLRYITFQSAYRLGADGELEPCAMDEYGVVSGMEDGAVYRLCATAVSYTHLDVYKRQGKASAMASVFRQAAICAVPAVSHDKCPVYAVSP